jgi:hypothetical protein
MAFRFEFDSVNKILLGRFEGKLTDESLAEFLRAIREYSTATDAKHDDINHCAFQWIRGLIEE